MKKFLLTVIIFSSVFISQPAHAIKIGLLTGVDSLSMGCSKKCNIVGADTNRYIYALDGMRSYDFRAYKNKIAIKTAGKWFDLGSPAVVIKPVTTGFVSAKHKWYRGIFILTNKNGKLVLINKLNIEDYIQGVVPSEMPSKWAYEAHKAQAIAARSYALANLGKRATWGYDLKDTPEDQAYGGASAETSQTNQAVKETRSIVLVYNLKIIPAYYSASAGGHTVTSGQVWTKDLPYVRSVPSFDDNVKKNGHGVGMSQHGANNLAKQGYNAYQILQYFYKNIKFAKINEEYYE